MINASVNPLIPKRGAGIKKFLNLDLVIEQGQPSQQLRWAAINRTAPQSNLLAAESFLFVKSPAVAVE